MLEELCSICCRSVVYDVVCMGFCSPLFVGESGLFGFGFAHCSRLLKFFLVLMRRPNEKLVRISLAVSFRHVGAG